MKSPTLRITLFLILWMAGGWLVRAPAVAAGQAGSPPDRLGPTNRALSLDGATASVAVAESPSLHAFANALTLEAWVRPSSFYPTPGSVNSILRKNVKAGAENFFLRIRNTEGPSLVEFGLGPQLGVMGAACEMRTNQWCHLAATYDGQTAAVLVNGSVIGSKRTSGSLMIDASELVIGRGDPEYSSGEYFHGVLDEIRVWNVARSPAQIGTAMKGPLTGKEAGLVAYWNFDDGTPADFAGHGNTGRLQGNARFVEVPRPATLAGVGAGSRTADQTRSENLTLDPRLAVVEALWRSLSQIYPALEYKGIRGRDWIEPAVGRAKVARSDQEFYDILLEQIARLQDTHTRIISHPGQPVLETPPVMLNEVEGKVAVIRAHPDTRLLPGDIIVSIEDRPVAECLAEQMRRVCNSTARGRVREACGQLLRGPPGTSVNVRAQHGGEALREVALRRESLPEFWREPVISHRRLSEAIGCIRIARWTDNSIPDQFDEALEAFKDMRGIIIDVRGNGGGNDQLADLVNGRLIKQPVVSSIDFWRKAGTDEYHRTIGWVHPRGPWPYRGRVAVLTDEASMSACEHFVSGVEATGKVLLVGTPTNGAGGGPTTVKLPDGTRVAISRALGIRANGVVFEGHGIPPHVFSTPTIEDLRQGRDPAMEVAANWILSNQALPPRVQPLQEVRTER